MRVAFDIHTLGQNATGNETYAEGLRRSFLLDPPPDMDFVFYQTNPVIDGELAGRLRQLRPGGSILRLLLATPLALQRDHVDVAHFQYFAPPIAVCPNVLTIHDLSFERHPELFSMGMAWTMRLLLPYQVRRAAHIITVSHATRDDLVDLYDVAPERISVIHNGVAEAWRPMTDQTALRRGLARFRLKRPFILSVGNLGARKNQLALVRTFGRLIKARRIECDLVLAGKPTESADGILAEIKRAGLDARVHVTGFVSQEELLCLYNAASFSAYLSLYEGFGLPILESMACGLPVLTSAISCMPEVAGDAALLVDPRDDEAIYSAMLRMTEDKALRESLRQKGLQRAQAFSWGEAARRTAAVYRQVHQARSTRR